ncbi:MAG: DUF6452 family protein [Bacteroidota bacterium]
MKTILIPVIMILLITSCGTQDICDDDSQSILVARLMTMQQGEKSDTTLQGFSVYGIREGSVDSLLYDSMNVSRIELPLDPSAGQSKFVMFTADKRDTLTLLHTSEAYLISYNCGFAARFTLEEPYSTREMITEIELVEALVDAELEIDETHLQIFF